MNRLLNRCIYIISPFSHLIYYKTLCFSHLSNFKSLTTSPEILIKKKINDKDNDKKIDNKFSLQKVIRQSESINININQFPTKLEKFLKTLKKNYSLINSNEFRKIIFKTQFKILENIKHKKKRSKYIFNYYLIWKMNKWIVDNKKNNLSKDFQKS